MFKFIDLFSGIGGFRIAGERQGGQCVFSCEIDKIAKTVYYRNFKDTPYPDIRTLSVWDIPDYDVLFAGFPCQPFSISGLKRGFNDEKNGDLFFHLVRIIRDTQPKAFILENVKFFTKIQQGRAFRFAVETLERLGYKIYSKVLNSKYFGVAQSRERVFIVGIHKDFRGIFVFPEGKKDKVFLEQVLDKDAVDESLIFKGEVIFEKEDIKQNVFRPYRLGYVNRARQGERVYSVKGLSITISFSTGGVFSRTGGYLTPQGVRKLTVSEVKRLFGFPVKFSFEDVSYNQAISLLGNSVVVPLVEEILKNVLFVIGYEDFVEMGSLLGLSEFNPSLISS